MIKAPQIMSLLGIRNDISDLCDSSMVLFDRIFEKLSKLEPETPDGDKIWRVWLTADRGTLDDFDFEDEDEAFDYFGVNNEFDLKDAFEEEFSDEKYWFHLEVSKNKYCRVLSIADSFVMQIHYDKKLQNLRHGNYPYNYDTLLSWVDTELDRVLAEVEANTYNENVEKNLPYDLRYGTIQRKVYWEHCPESKEENLENLTSEDIEQFMMIVKQQNKYGIPDNRIPHITFNKYFEIASLAFAAIGYDTKELLTCREQFDRYGEDFGAGIFDKLDMDSEKDFEDYLNGKYQMCGHPWGILSGSSRTRIVLYPIKDEDGYYFKLDGNVNWAAYELVRIFLALVKNNIPVLLREPDEIVQYLRGEDYIGVVPRTKQTIYCQRCFFGKDVNDFEHYDLDKDKGLFEYIDWEPLQQLSLKRG